MPRHVRKGDTVMITAGSHKGKMGRIKEVITKDDRVVVEGLNLRTKHLKPTRTNPQGGIITREAPIHISNVSPVVDGKPTRVRFNTLDDGSKVRVAATTGATIGRAIRNPSDGAAKSPAPGRKKTAKATA